LSQNANPAECRLFQLEGLLGWKKYDAKEAAPKKDEFKYYEIEENLTTCNLEDFGDELEGILINPPWNGKKYDISKFVKI
jgi:hypothetical protein